MALHIITGPPGAGKTTFVAERAQPGDIRIDLDHLTNHLAGLPLDGHNHDSRVWAVAKAARIAAIDTALKHSSTMDVWIIDSSLTGKNLQRYQEHDAQVHVIDPGKSVVMSRCKAERPPEALKVAGLWYSKNKPSATSAAVQPSTGKRQLSRQERGYGRSHELQRDYLLAQLVDGDECDICGEPMYRDPLNNLDEAPLEADHKEGDKTKPAYRLLHRRCNRSISNKWVEHGPGWERKHQPRASSLPGGTLTQW